MLSAFVSVMVDRKLLRIVLDPLGERNIDGVSTAAIEMIEAYLIETIDPLGRYLPSVEILVKDREPVQVVEAVQINNNWQWSFKTGENLPIIPLMKTYAGTVALGSLHQFGAFHGVQFGINLILPIPDEVDDSQIYSIYHTPGNNTFLLIPEGFNAGRGRGLASFAPQGGLFPEYVIFSFVAMPTTSITGFIRAAQSIPVSDYVGIAYSDFLWASLKAEEDKNGLPIGYEHPVGVSEEIVNWLNYDRGFVSAIFFLEHIQEPIPCVEKDALHTVVK